MANVSGGGTLWNLPNLDGALFASSNITTPFLDRVTRTAISNNSEFAMSSNYALESAAQPAITETASLTAPTAVSYVRDNETNVAQIFQRKISVSYQKLSNGGRLRYPEVSTSGYGYSTYPGSNGAADELQFQVQANLDQIRQDMEYTFLNGVYQLATAANVAYKTRGIIAGSSTNTVAASGAKLSKALVDQLLKEMADNAAPFASGRYVLFANSFNKQVISDIYSYVPDDRNMGGSNIQRIMTDFAEIEVVYSHNVPAATVLLADVSKVGVVFQPVPGKSTIDQNVVLEMLAKTGAGEDWQLYVQSGVDYGSSRFHGTLTGLATA